MYVPNKTTGRGTSLTEAWRIDDVLVGVLADLRPRVKPGPAAKGRSVVIYVSTDE